MVGILPERAVTRQRLIIGFFLIAVTSTLALIGLDLGPFGAPWPIAILWAVCGWMGLGPNALTAVLMFALGLWVDVLTGAHIGTWAFVGVASLSLALLGQHFVGLGNLPPLLRCSVCGVIMIVVIVGFEIGQRQRLDIVGAILPILTATVLYPFLARWFELFEDDA